MTTITHTEILEMLFFWNALVLNCYCKPAEYCWKLREMTAILAALSFLMLSVLFPESKILRLHQIANIQERQSLVTAATTATR